MRLILQRNEKKMLFSGLILLIGIISLTNNIVRAGVSSNKFDIQAIASMRGLAGQNNFGEMHSKGSLAVSFFITPFYNSGSVSWGPGGNKNSKVTKPLIPGTNNSTGSAYYDYGILEENGYWDAAGIFYGFATSDFLYPYMVRKGVINTAGNAQDLAYSTLLYFAPKDYALISGINNYVAASEVGNQKGFGQLSEDADLLFADATWDAGHYANYYLAFLRNIGINDLSLTSDAAVKVAPDPASSSNLFPALDNTIKKALMPDNFGYSAGDKASGEIIFNPLFRKTGCRFSSSVAVYSGVCVNARCGVSEVWVSATAKDAAASSTYPIASNYDLLAAALQDLGASLDDYHHTGLEDAYLNVIAGEGFRFGGKGLVVYPFVTAGAWVPTSKNYHDAEGNKYCFYVPMGNEGHVGYSVGAGVSLDFTDILCMTIGGGGVFFDSITIPKYRMPNHRSQRGFYPFTIDISRKKGAQYYGYLSLKSVNFEDGFSYYCDLVYTKHMQDTITLCDSDSKRNALFEQGRQKIMSLSNWSACEANFGLSILVSENVQCGGALTTNINGDALPCVRTICGTVSFAF